MLNGLSLFTGYAGIDIALADYVRPVLYCEIERYPQAILVSRMDDRSAHFAPIWNDVTTLDGKKLRGLVDIITAGFPCQDISTAGKGAGLEGKRSGLFYEVARLVEEIRPSYILLENVPAIRTRGAVEVQKKLSSLGYDSRWTTLSAYEVGGCHNRERWFCLASDPECFKLWEQSRWSRGKSGENSTLSRVNGEKGPSSDSVCVRTQVQAKRKHPAIKNAGSFSEDRATIVRTVWPTKSGVCRADDAPAYRVDRIKALGNGVVPEQVKTAFEKLMGIT